MSGMRCSGCGVVGYVCGWLSLVCCVLLDFRAVFAFMGYNTSGALSVLDLGLISLFFADFGFVCCCRF